MLLWFEGFEGLGVTEGPSNQDNITEELLRIMSVVAENSTSFPFLRPGEEQGKALALQNTNTVAGTQVRYHHYESLVGTEFVLGFRWKPSSLLTSGSTDILVIFHENNAGTPQIRLRLETSDNSMDFYVGNTLVDSSAASVWSPDTWFHVELKLLMADGTGGSYEIRIDDTTQMSDTGVDTLQTSTVGASVFQWTATDAAGDDTSAKETQLDDIYLLDTTGSVNNDFLGSQAVVIRKAPNADGTTNDFTPQSGVNNFEMVNENPASTTDYNDGSTNGDIDEYGIPDIEQDTIFGIAIETHMTTSDVGRERKFRHRVRSGASVGNGSDIGVIHDYSHRTIFETDPNTSSAWTKTNANAAEFGVEVRD